MLSSPCCGKTTSPRFALRPNRSTVAPSFGAISTLLSKHTVREQIKKQNSPMLVGAKIRRSYFKSLRRISRRVSRPMQRRKKPKSTRRQTKDSCAPTKSVRRCRLHCDRYSRICYIGRIKMLACAKNGELMSSMSSDCIDLSCDKRHNAWSKTARFMRSTTFFT